jgi:glutathione synthase/RimK-type ligase-like ATP-grasp enzyme
MPAILDDDGLCLAPLLERGIEVQGIPWTAHDAGWERFDAVIIRSTWDYHDHLERFEDWIRQLQRRDVRLLNPPDVVLGNLNKRYLARLEGEGVKIVTTRWADPDLSAIQEAIASLETEEVAVKPVVSAGAKGLVRLRADAFEAQAAELEAALVYGPVMVQPFLPAIETEGEYSLHYFDRQLSHTILKRPKPGDCRSQEEWGSFICDVHPPSDVREAADRVLSQTEGDLLYARVDLVREQGVPSLIELELTEPALYFRYDREGPRRFAKALARRL